MAIRDDITAMVVNESTINVLNEIKNRWGGFGYDGVTLGWVADTYSDIVQKLKTAIEANVLSEIPNSKLKLVFGGLQTTSNNAIAIQNYTYPDPNPPASAAT